MDDPLPPAIPAATVVVMREANGGPPELLMVERAKAMTFAGGAQVFPGGRVDPADRALAARAGGDPDDTAARIAAIRETIEETGLAIGLASPPAYEALAATRASLHAGVPLGELLASARTSLDLAALIPFARWRPAHRHMRIFDTRFYLARAPEDAAEAVADATENTRAFWATATAVLADADAGRATIIFPTRRNLERLAQFATIDAALADAAAHPIETITPFSEQRDGVDYLCIPEGLGYPVTAQPLAASDRG